MRKWGAGLLGWAALVGLMAMLVAGSATAAGAKKTVEGTVYNTTCGSGCSPCPPPCGPIPAPQSKADYICAQRLIVCPLQKAQRICLPQTNCGSYPVYAGEGADVTVRKRGSSTVLATLPIVEGHFNLRLAPGEYVLRPHLPGEECWAGPPQRLTVTAKIKSPVPATVYFGNSCVAHPDNG